MVPIPSESKTCVDGNLVTIQSPNRLVLKNKCDQRITAVLEEAAVNKVSLSTSEPLELLPKSVHRT